MSGLVAAAFFGQGFFRTLIFLALAFLWGFALFELAKSHSRGWVKALWLLAIIFVPVVGSVVYLLTLPRFSMEPDPVENAASQQRARDELAVEMARRASN